MDESKAVSSGYTDICVMARRSRTEFDNANYQAAYRLYSDAFATHTNAWWLAMEAIRSIRAQTSSRPFTLLVQMVWMPPPGNGVPSESVFRGREDPRCNGINVPKWGR